MTLRMLLLTSVITRRITRVTRSPVNSISLVRNFMARFTHFIKVIRSVHTVTPVQHTELQDDYKYRKSKDMQF